jgi:hypothetical protein
MIHQNRPISRRDFLKYSIFGAGALALTPRQLFQQFQEQFPDAEKLGRVTQGRLDIRSKPFSDAAITKTIYDDAVVVWLREVVGEAPGGYGSSRWVETPDGYIYAPRLQPVYNRLNTPLTDLPASPNPASPTGKGIWAEVTVPYVDIVLRHAPNSVLFKEKIEQGFPPRMYYDMIVWVIISNQGTMGSPIIGLTSAMETRAMLIWCLPRRCGPSLPRRSARSIQMRRINASR